MVGLRVVGSCMVSWGRHMVGGGSVDHGGRGVSRSRGVGRCRGIGGRGSIWVTTIGSCHKGQRDESLK